MYSSQPLYLPPRPTHVPMQRYKRMNTADLEEPIDLSDKTEKEIEVILEELQFRYKLHMINNAQLDNEKQALYYQVDDLTDQLDEESHAKAKVEVQLKSCSRQVDDGRRRQLQLDIEIAALKDLIQEQDQLISDNQLVMVPLSAPTKHTGVENDLDGGVRELLQLCRNGSPSTFEKEIRRLVEQSKETRQKIQEAKAALTRAREEKTTTARQPRRAYDETDAVLISVMQEQKQREVMKHEQEVEQARLKIDSLENQLLRLESQMHRHRETYEESDKSRRELKSEIKKLSRQKEEAGNQLEECERMCTNLQTRVTKVKSARLKALGSTLEN